MKTKPSKNKHPPKTLRPKPGHRKAIEVILPQFMFKINAIFVLKKKLELFCLPFPQTASSSTAKVTDFKLTTGVPGSCQNTTAGSLKKKYPWCDVHLVTA